MPPWSITYSEDIPQERKLIDDMIKGRRETFNIEKRLLKKNGETVWMLCNVSAVKNRSGEIIYLLSYLLDITEQKTIRQQLENQLDFFHKLMDAIPNPIFIKNIGGKHVRVNKAFADYIGKDYDDSTYMGILSMLPKAEADEIIESCAKAISSNQIQQRSIALQGMPEGHSHAIVNIAPYTDINGNITGIIGCITDITHVKERERQLMEAKEYDRIKNEFFANISHELRTPLNVILGTLQLLNLYNKNKTNNGMDKHLCIMKQNCYRLLRLVSNLIDITKIDSGYFRLSMGRYDIVNIIEDITLSLVEYVEQKGMTLQFDTDVEEKIINCDPDQMERIMMNLISNAVKFSDAGGKISVNINDNEESIVIRVKDTGIGIPEDKQSFIFERFRQVDKSLTRDNEGSGIGLSLVKSLVEMHGGTISVISSPGAGSEFIIELPADQEIISHDEICATADIVHIERIKIEFSDIYS